MTNDQQAPRHPAGLWAIVALGLALRLGWLWSLHGQALQVDGPEYLRIAQAIRAGGYRDDGRWLRPPLFPAWLALTLGPAESRLLAQVAQVALGTLLVGLLYAIAWRAYADRRVALLCAGVAAVYLPLIEYATYLMPETLFVALLCGLLLALLAFGRAPSLRRAALVGALLGLAALTKPIALFTLPAVAVGLWQASPGVARRAAHIGVALLCAAALVAPWSLRSSSVQRQFVLLDTTAGYNLWLGSLPPGGDWEFSVRMGGARMNPAQREQRYREQAWRNIQHDPVNALRQVGGRLVSFWRTNLDVLASQQTGELAMDCGTQKVPEPFGMITPEAAALAVDDTRLCGRLLVQVAADVVYVPLLAGGVAMLLGGRRHRFGTLAWCWLLAMYGAMALTITQPRLRLAVAPVLLPYAAAGLVRLWARARARRAWPARARVVALGLAAVLLWGLNILPLAASEIWAQIAWRAWQRGDTLAAAAHDRTAAALYPTRTALLIAAGASAEALGRDDEALRFYNAASAVVFAQPEAHIGAARVLQRRGDAAGVAIEEDQSSVSSARLAALGFASARLPPRARLDLGGAAAAEYGYTLGLYPAEPGSAPSLRISAAHAAFRFGTQPTPQSTLTLRMSSGRATDATVPNVSLQFAGQTTSGFPVGTTWRVYRVLVPPTQTGVRVDLFSETYVPAQSDPATRDRRALGVALDQLAIGNE